MKGGARVTRNLVEQLGWAAFNPTTALYRAVVQEYAFNDKNKMDFDWIEASIAYINDMPEDDRRLVTFYTKYGDELVNTFMRAALSQDKLSEILSGAANNATKQYVKNHLIALGAVSNTPSNIIKVMEPYMVKLTSLILAAPPLNYEIKVFRGVRNMKWMSNGTYTEPGFMSSTIFLPATLQFMEDACCLLEIRVRAGTRCVFIASASKKRGEYEVLFPPGIVLKVVGKSEKYFVDEINPDPREVERAITEPKSVLLFRKYTVYEAII
jgi:hypothetical protein